MFIDWLIFDADTLGDIIETLKYCVEYIDNWIFFAWVDWLASKMSNPFSSPTKTLPLANGATFKKFRTSGFEFEVLARYDIKKFCGYGAFGVVT